MSGFIFTCFILGLISAAPVGPLCILVFNRGAQNGFWRGWFTGCGSALADACYCALGLTGLLQSLGTHHSALYWLYRVGGIALAAMGIALIIAPVPKQQKERRVSGYIASLLQGFMLTFLNPMVILFFMTAGMHLIATQAAVISREQVMLGAGTVFLGVLSVITVVSFLGKMMGAALSSYRIKQLRVSSGLVLALVGVAMIGGVGGRTPAFLTQLSQLFS